MRTVAEAPSVLVVTNDFPPRVGGVQQYVWNLVSRLPPDRVSVLAPAWPGWREHDAEQSFPIHRWPSSVLWPTGDLERRVASLARAHRADVVLFGHGFPLPMLAPKLRAARLPSVILTHGAEVWMARTPGLAGALGRGLGHARTVTAVSQFTAGHIRRLVPPGVPLTVLHPGVDPDRFEPSQDGEPVRADLGIGEGPVVMCASRLVRRKGQDVLIKAMDLVTKLVPGVVLLLVGDGPEVERLRSLAERAPPGSVLFAGQVPDPHLPRYYAACDLFAMPCRSRWGGLEVEGFGIVYLEAGATGRAVVAGRSGGAPEAIADQETGLLVEGREPKAVALSIARLLLDPGFRKRMGAAGRARVLDRFTWAGQAGILARILADAAG